MSPKKTILKTLTVEYESSGPGVMIRPAAIPGFGENPEKYQKAVNDLLQERLIEGRKDEEGKMAISLNDHRKGEVKKILRPLWLHPAIVVLIGLLAIAATAGFMG